MYDTGHCFPCWEALRLRKTGQTMAVTRLDLRTTAQQLQRLVMLDVRVFDDVRADPAATVPAITVAASSMLMLGLGGWLWWITSGLGDQRAVLIKSAVLGTIFSIVLWLV